MQPEGLRESSRWSKGSEDHRKAGNKSSTLMECKILAGMSGTLSECASGSLATGGLRYA